uniref:Ubiquitin-like protease family profile domain-containing protein n=1 Tax=Trichogramma kaykai TaxID=54128 RepID=A0ABD2WGL7_9HYME
MSLHRSEDQIIIPSDDDDEDDFFQLRSVALTYKSVKLLSCQEICPQIPQEFFDAMPVKEVFIMRYYFQLTHESIEACFAQFQLEDWSYFNLNGEPRIILYSNQLCSLKSNEYVNGALIDAYMTVKIAQKKSKNISFLPTTLTISILGRNRDNPKNSSFNGFKLNHTIEGLIFMPYCLGSHWSLLVADVAKKELTEYDPLDDDDDDDDDEQESCPKSSKAAIYFMRYLNRYNLCAPDNTWNVTKIQWTIASPNIPKRPVQKDDYNCGIFVIHYMNLLAGDISLSSFNPDEFRVKLALYLLENSENVQDICLRCEKQEDLVASTRSTLNQLMKETFEGEDTNLNCKSCVRSTKHSKNVSTFTKTPKYLFVSLCRYLNDGGKVVKINDHMAIDEVINLDLWFS